MGWFTILDILWAEIEKTDETGEIRQGCKPLLHRREPISERRDSEIVP